MLYQPPLPPRYSQLSERQLQAGIAQFKRLLGNRLVILGHHYQQDEIIAFADFTGDSLKLSQLAAEQTQAEFIVFCGVHFMAESADILSSDAQQVILPDLAAGCSMADMATLDQVETAWANLTQHTQVPIIPITYVNSLADIKAFVGQHDGACCTSSNARAVLEWALQGIQPSDSPDRGRKVMFLPDQHLGRNTAYVLGWPLESMALYDPYQPQGGLTPEQVRQARFILWKGHCSVHQLFDVKQVETLRARPEPYRILVHPECPWEVAVRSDLMGSTEYIVRTVRDAPAGSYWAIGTEVHLVNRLANTYPDKTIRSLADVQCLCTTMYRIDLKHLYWTLENLAAGQVVNRIMVDDQVKRWSRVALDRMLELRPTRPAPVR